MTDDDDDREPIDIDMWEWQEVRSPDVVEVGGLGPCIGVIFYDASRKTALAGHFPDMWDGPFEECISHFQKTFDPQNTVVYVGGGAIDDTDNEEYGPEREEQREHCEATIRSLDIPSGNVSISWGPSNLITDMQLDTRTGKFSQSSYDVPTDEYDDDP